MTDKVQENNMIQAYIFQKLANKYWYAVAEYTQKIGNTHLNNKIRDVFKNTQKVFTPIDVYMKKTNGLESVEDMQMEYMDVFEMVTKLSPTELAKEKERLKKIIGDITQR